METYDQRPFSQGWVDDYNNDEDNRKDGPKYKIFKYSKYVLFFGVYLLFIIRPYSEVQWSPVCGTFLYLYGSSYVTTVQCDNCAV